MTKGTEIKLKIGFVLDDGLDKPDGVQQYILTLGEWFKQNGHEIRYLTGQTKRKDIPELIELSKNLKVSFNGNSLSVPIYSSAGRIKKVLKKENFDIIHIQTPFSPVMGARVIKNLPKHTAAVSTFHIMPLSDSAFYRYGNRLTGISIKSALKRIDKHFSVSKPAQEFAKKAYGIDSEVLSNPVVLPKNPTAGKDFSKKQTLTIVFLGRLVSRKGCLTLLEAINDLSADHKRRVQVKIGGSGAERSRLERYTETRGLEKAVKFCGFIDEEDKFEFLKNSDLAVFPSKGGESFGIVLAEAMSAGGPVVLAGDNPGYRSVLENDEVLFDPNDFHALSKKISGYIDSPALMNRVFESQQKLVKKYDINKIGERLLVNFRSIVQNKSK